MITIEDWSVGTNELYGSPEAAPKLHGKVYGHPRFEDGHSIQTSIIVDMLDARTVETYSGSIYRLGKPSQDFVEWCKANGAHVPTDAEPIKFRPV